MPSKALFVLWIVTITLPSCSLGGTVEEDIPRFKTWYHDHGTPSDEVYLARVGSKGQEMVHPDDPNKVLRIIRFKEGSSTATHIAEYNAIKQMMDRGEALGNIGLLTPRLYRRIEFDYGSDEAISMEMDRYRGNLGNGIRNDAVLRASLFDFSKRLDMYKQLAFIFQQMSALKIKHCNIEVNRILYKKAGDDFTTMPLVETDSEFIFVISEFRSSTALDNPCKDGILATWDQEDAKGSIPKSDKCKGKIEIFGLGLLILKIETVLVLMDENGARDASQNITDALATMPDSPTELSEHYEEKKPITTNNSYNILDEIMLWIKNANSNPDNIDESDKVISGKALLPNTAYIEMANALIFEQREILKSPTMADNSKVRGKVVNNYAALNSLLQSMLQPNDYVNGRPDAAYVGTALAKIQQGYVANIQSLNRDRILLV